MPTFTASSKSTIQRIAARHLQDAIRLRQLVRRVGLRVWPDDERRRNRIAHDLEWRIARTLARAGQIAQAASRTTGALLHVRRGRQRVVWQRDKDDAHRRRVARERRRRVVAEVEWRGRDELRRAGGADRRVERGCARRVCARGISPERRPVLRRGGLLGAQSARSPIGTTTIVSRGSAFVGVSGSFSGRKRPHDPCRARRARRRNERAPRRALIGVHAAGTPPAHPKLTSLEQLGRGQQFIERLDEACVGIHAHPELGWTARSA